MGTDLKGKKTTVLDLKRHRVKYESELNKNVMDEMKTNGLKINTGPKKLIEAGPVDQTRLEL